MDILLCLDNAYSPYATAVINSVCINNTGAHNFYIITDYISEDNKNKIRKFSNDKGSNVYFLNIDKDDTKGFPIGRKTANTYISIATYFRLFLLRLLPQEVQKIIYLDCDLVVDGDISSLWNTPIHEDKLILAVEDDNRSALKGPKRLGYDSKFSYFNAGVMLVNVSGIRKICKHEDIINYIKNNTDKILYHDQDVLNAMFHKYVQFLPLRYNVLDANYVKGHKLNNRYKKEKDAIFHPLIIHFSGPIKPWHTECRHPLKNKYIEYINNTPYGHNKIQRKYCSLSSRIKFSFKEVIKCIFERLHIKMYSYISERQYSEHTLS